MDIAPIHSMWSHRHAEKTTSVVHYEELARTVENQFAAQHFAKVAETLRVELALIEEFLQCLEDE